MNSTMNLGQNYWTMMTRMMGRTRMSLKSWKTVRNLTSWRNWTTVQNCYLMSCCSTERCWTMMRKRMTGRMNSTRTMNC
jgi:hypothetical protein